MAKKKKEDIDKEEDINQESQDDLNEADDSFGLPDVDYEPIDRDEDDSSTSENPEEEVDEEDKHAYETESEEHADDVYATAAGETGDDEPPEKEYVPGSYTPPKDDSIAGKVVAIVLVLLLAGAAIWYFGFYQPEQKRMEQAKIEKQKQEQAEKERLAREEEERRRQEELEAQRAAEEKEAAEQKPEVGTIETVPQRTGRYYTVVSSSIDNDLARDYAEKLKKQGVGTYILIPSGTNKFTRIAVSSHETWNQAATAAEKVKSEYGENVWVIKY